MARTNDANHRRNGDSFTKVFIPKGENHSGEEHKPFNVRKPHPCSIAGMAVRTSTRWFDSTLSKRMCTPIPYVSVSGKFSAETLCFWTAHPEQVLASLTSTVYLRIRKIVRKRHSLSFANKSAHTLLCVAAYYVVNHNDSFMDRCLGILRRRKRRQLHNFYTQALSKSDDDKRFVINQICSQISWLTFRSKYPCEVRRKRDKSGYNDTDPIFSLLQAEVISWDNIDRLRLKGFAQAWTEPSNSKMYAQGHLSPRSESVDELFESETPFDFDDDLSDQSYD